MLKYSLFSNFKLFVFDHENMRVDA